LNKRFFAIVILGSISLLNAIGIQAEQPVSSPLPTTACDERKIEEIHQAGSSARVEDNGNTTSARLYEENNTFKDFEVHFLVSLPFTAFYSYLTVMSIDSMVQGQFPTEFRQANTWMIIGFAVGGSLAVALGSMNRVPDQSIYRLESRELRDEDKVRDQVCAKLEVLRIKY
jgi:hypothetical protein